MPNTGYTLSLPSKNVGSVNFSDHAEHDPIGFTGL